MVVKLKCKNCKQVTGQYNAAHGGSDIRWIICNKCSGFNEYIPVKKG